MVTEIVLRTVVQHLLKGMNRNCGKHIATKTTHCLLYILMGIMQNVGDDGVSVQ
jgi:hypothetical protein